MALIAAMCCAGVVLAEPGNNHLISVDLTSGRAAGDSYSTAVPTSDGRQITFVNVSAERAEKSA